jgi:hypothetical protein
MIDEWSTALKFPFFERGTRMIYPLASIYNLTTQKITVMINTKTSGAIPIVIINDQYTTEALELELNLFSKNLLLLIKTKTLIGINRISNPISFIPVRNRSVIPDTCAK